MAGSDVEQRLLEALKGVAYPGFSRDIVSFGLVHDIRVDGGKVDFELRLVTDNADVARKVAAEARRAAEAVDGVDEVDVKVMVQASRPTRLPGAGPSSAPPPGPGLLEGVGRVLAVASGKGGVGKSTVAVNLAVALAARGRRVGLLDADIYGPSIPLMFGLQGARPELEGTRALPLERYGVRMISIGFFLGRDDAVVWRGPMVMKAVEQLLGDVAWGELDDLIVDLPPGTGDAQLTLAQKIRLHGVVVVTTPNDLALIDAAKGVAMFRKVEVPVLGIVENMSYFACPHCEERTAIFAEGGGRRECERLGISFLGEIPLDPRIRAGSDDGHPVVAAEPASAQARAFVDLADKLVEGATAPTPPKERGSFFDRFRRA